MATFLTILFMVLAFVGMIVCAKIQKTNPNAKTYAIICLVVVVICAVKFLIDQGAFGGQSREMKLAMESYERFNESSAKAVGEYLSKKYPNESIVIVASGGENFAKNPNKQVEYLKKYLKQSDVTVKGLPYTSNPNQPDSMMDESASAKYFNKLFEENASTKIFVLTISLPFDPGEAAKISLWGKKDGQKLILLNADVHYLYGEIKGGVVPAAVVMKPNLTQKDFEENAPEDLNKAFNARYLLITQDNVDDIAAKSNLFAK